MTTYGSDLYLLKGIVALEIDATRQSLACAGRSGHPGSYGNWYA